MERNNQEVEIFDYSHDAMFETLLSEYGISGWNDVKLTDSKIEEIQNDIDNRMGVLYKKTIGCERFLSGGYYYKYVFEVVDPKKFILFKLKYPEYF